MGKLSRDLELLYNILVKENVREFIDDIADIKSNLTDIEKIKRLEYLCHIKVLGDVYIDSLSHIEWGKLLSDIVVESRIAILRLKIKDYPDLHQTLSKNIELFYNSIISTDDIRSIEKLDRIRNHLFSKKYVLQLKGLCGWFLRKGNEHFLCEYGNWEDFLRELINETEIWYQNLLDSKA